MSETGINLSYTLVVMVIVVVVVTEVVLVKVVWG